MPITISSRTAGKPPHSKTCLLGLMAVMGVGLFSSSAHTAGEKSLSDNINFSDCSIGQGAISLAAQCATLTVQLDSRQNVYALKKAEKTVSNPKLKPDIKAAVESGPVSNTRADGNGSIQLSIARIPARRLSDRQDAFTLIAGGPGQSAIETFPSVSFAFQHIMQDHDVILIDQRGTGASEKLVCASESDPLALTADADLAQISSDALACRASLPHDPYWFTSSMAVNDLEYVRQMLNVSQWNMYGISYGTRVAMHYLRRFPDSIRTLTLDAVLPPSVSLGPDIARLSQRALDLIFTRCVNDQGCFSAFGDLTKPTMALLGSLEKAPKKLTFEDIATGSLSTMELTRQQLAATIRLLSYSPQTAAILPSMLHEAIVNENFAPLARQVKLQAQSLDHSLANGMHQAIICTEDAPYVNASDAGDEAATYLGQGTLDALLANCENWPAGFIDADFKDALATDVPILILSGEADPITPPGYGESITSTLPNSRHIINEDQGHMQAPFGCMPVLLAQFVSTADAKNLNIDCLDRLRVTPFFVDANGPLP